MSLTSTIVTVAAQGKPAPQPSLLQQSGACISVGATTPLVTNSAAYYATLAQATAAIGSTGNHAELTKMVTTFFAQGDAVGIWILELGAAGSSAAGITALGNWITANPGQFYAYLVPATWDTDAAAAMNTLAANYSSASGKTYFFVTTTSGNLSAYVPTSKAVVATVPSPTAASGEFQAAAIFYQWLANNPNAASPAAPMDFRFVFGVTPWVLTNNASAINAIVTLGGNVILTGAEGGISNALIRNGTTMDLNQMMFWYAVDWVAINSKLRLAAAIIDGSNENPPLYYNQAGINRLLAVLTNLGIDGTSFGLLLSADFSATPFTTYTAAHPGDYAAGTYNGFSALVTPQLGFEAIEFFLDATQFVS